jgi:pimeloyl-ACP methyl ester carboxylesterase
MKKFLIPILLLIGPALAHADTVVTGSINADTEWSPVNGVYIISGQVTVPIGVTLTIDPGTIVKTRQGSGPALGLDIFGSLVAQGGVANQIYFTSYTDDSVGGDTNGDSTTSVPQANGWAGISFETGSSGSLSQASVRYAGGFDPATPNRSSGIINFGGALNIDSSIFNQDGNAGILQKDGTLTLTNSTVSQNATGIYLQGGLANLTGNSFLNNLADGFRADAPTNSATLTNNNFVGNHDPASLDASVQFTHSGNTSNDTFRRVWHIGGDLTGNHTWDSSDLPTQPFIHIVPGAVLTLVPGTILKFEQDNQIQVDGTLNAEGTTDDPVYFTQIGDDSIGGDSDPGGSPSGPNAGFAIPFRIGSAGNLDHVVIHGGGSIDQAPTDNTIYNYGGNVSITNSQISDTQQNSIYQSGGALTLQKDEFARLGSTVLESQGGNYVIDHNSFHDTSRYLLNTTATPVDMRNNWWGSDAGPDPANFTGPVLFDPWLTSDPLATSSPAHTPILIVPGVLGTNILKASSTLWFDLGHTFTDAGDEFMDPLQFSSSLLPIDTGLTLGSVVGKVGILNLSLDYSDGLVKELESEGYTLNKDLFLLPYDWRYGIDATNTDALSKEIELIRTQTGSDKVDVVAHSTGGLLVKKYAMDNPASNHIGKAIFVGVPNTGAPQAVKVLLQGDEFGDPFLSDAEMQKIAANLPVVYDLLPSQQYVDQKGSYVQIVNRGLFTSTSQDLDYAETKDYLTKDHSLNSQAVADAESLHTSAFDNYDLRTAGIDLYSIVGCKTGTLGTVIETRAQDIFGGTNVTYSLTQTPGDGTVPLESATNLPIDSANKYYALKADHSQMMTGDGILQEIVNLLTGSNLDTDGIITQDISQCGLNGKAISIFSPLRIDVVDQNGNHTGQDANGNIFNQIPNANFELVGEHKMLYLPTDDNQVYTINVSGTGTGTFTLQDDDITNSVVTNTNVFSNVPVTTSLTGTLGLESNTLSLDSNGDGQIDQILSPDEGALSLSDLLSALTAQIQLLSVKDKVKQNLLNKVTNLEKQISNKEQKNVKTIAAFQAKLSKQASKGKIDATTLDDMSALLDAIGAQAESLVIDQTTFDSLRAQIQALSITQNQKNTFLKQLDTLQNNQRMIQSLSVLMNTIVRKNKAGQVSDADTQQLLDLLNQISGII